MLTLGSKILVIWFIFLNGLVFAEPSTGSGDGILPKGSNQAPGFKYTFKKAQDLDPSCFNYHLNPENGQFYFDQSGDQVYFIGKEKNLTKASLSKVHVLEINLNNLAINKIATLKSNDSLSIIGHGFPLDGISLFNFKQSTFDCGQGISQGVGIKWKGKEDVIKTFPEDYYKLIGSDRGNILVDRKQFVTRGFDLKSMQRHPPESIPKEGIPLYLDQTNRFFYTFLANEAWTLQRYRLPGFEIQAKLKLTHEMKLIQQGQRFGIGKLDPENPLLIRIKKIPGWSGKSFESYSIPLEPPFHSEHARVVFDFDSGLAAIFGSIPSIQKEWKHALVVDGKKESIVGMMKAPNGQYVSGVTIDPKGRFFVFVTKEIDKENLGTVSIFKFATRDWHQLHIGYE